ncbi:DUF2891 domain-containing protein [Kribbella alba]|uniref:DUF2891 domain-containing protein n=1 Tax=Kribbella alba TaxID=190197 RepID=A0ABN2FPK3_9ACTN
MTTVSEQAPQYAKIALHNLATDFPQHLDHLCLDAGDNPSPRELHPAFHSSFDWHSCVHMHWLLVRLVSDWPDAVDAEQIRAALDENLTPSALGVEAAYLRGAPSFERPYGWAWAMLLAAAVANSSDPAAKRWVDAIEPLADAVEELTVDWLRQSALPVRHGVHSNTAFALSLMIDAGRALGRDELVAACRAKALAWFRDDRDYPLRWEPSGEDFLSPALSEADLMRRVLSSEEYPGWLDAFLPGLTRGDTPLEPVAVRYPTDGRQGHLQGLNLTRAWQLSELSTALPAGDPRQPVLRAAAERHLDTALPGVVSGDFVHDHWLATFAYLALGGPLV